MPPVSVKITGITSASAANLNASARAMVPPRPVTAYPDLVSKSPLDLYEHVHQLHGRHLSAIQRDKGSYRRCELLDDCRGHAAVKQPRSVVEPSPRSSLIASKLEERDSDTDREFAFWTNDPPVDIAFRRATRRLGRIANGDQTPITERTGRYPL
jgi:hypothetical protein